MKDPVCQDSDSVADCGFKSAGFQSPATSYFYARGPLGLKSDKEYAEFSKAFYEGFDRSSELLNQPDRVSDDGYVGFASALWKFMVPKKSEPSMHNVMTGFFIPNSSDLQAGHKAGFGSTILIADKTLCSTGQRTKGSLDRAASFTAFEEDLGLTVDAQNLSCESMWSNFSWGGSANKLQYFTKQWGQEKCQAVGWETPYNAINRDEYKRCVCSENISLDNPSCQQASNEPDP